jgi:hypothetical protein
MRIDPHAADRVLYEMRPVSLSLVVVAAMSVPRPVMFMAIAARTGIFQAATGKMMRVLVLAGHYIPHSKIIIAQCAPSQRWKVKSRSPQC